MNEPPAARSPRETSRDGPLLRLARARPVVTLVLALLIGLAGAYGAILFRDLYLLFQTLAFGTGEEHLGVVDGAGKLVGFVHEVDVMLACNRALVQARREERGED